MRPSERERVKAALRAYLDHHQISVHDLAVRINADGKKVDPKTLHRYLDRRLIVGDPIVEVYREFVDGPGQVTAAGTTQITAREIGGGTSETRGTVDR